MCSRKNFKSLFSAGIVLALGVSNLHISSNENDWCHSARVTSPAVLTILALYWLPPLLAAGQTSQRERAHSLSSLPLLLAAVQIILFLSHHRESSKNYEESTSNLWAIGVWENILSSFIFPSKPTDPRRNKLDIFNSCFDFSILIPVLTTASQLLLWLRCLYSFSTLRLFNTSRDLQHKGSFRLKLLIKLPNWKLSISSSTHLFFLLI